VRLHKIELLNLNSLYGEHCLDLDKDLQGASLFLIHGRTGSGKSTLMDAVALALFGKTPRLNDVRNSPDTDPSGIVSRGTGESRALVEFSRLGLDGERLRYRAGWAVRRARKQATGNMQAPERSLEQQLPNGEWKILISERKVGLVQAEFDKALEGFSAEDFQRSMLLAQGQFDALLNASSSERARILERLTDTKEYKTLGDHAARLASAHRRNIDFLERQLEGTTSVDEERFVAATKQAEASRTELKNFADGVSAKNSHLDWWTKRTELREQLQQLTIEKCNLDRDQEAAAPTVKKLTHHERCTAAFGFLDERVKLDVAVTKNENDIVEQSVLHEKAATELRLLTEKQSALAALLADAETLRNELSDPCANLLNSEAEEAKQAKALKDATLALKKAANEEEESTHAVDLATSLLEAAIVAAAEQQTALAKLGSIVVLREAWEMKLREDWTRSSSAEQSLSEEQRALGQVEGALRAERSAVESLSLEHATKKENLAQPEETADEARKHLQWLCGDEKPDKATALARAAAEQARAFVVGTEDAQREIADTKELATEVENSEQLLTQSQESEAEAIAKVTTLRLAAEHSKERAADAAKYERRLSLVGEIAKQREALVEGENCALCGSLEHPYIKHPEARPDESAAQMALSEAQAECTLREKEFANAEAVARAAEELAIKAQAKAKAASVAADAAKKRLADRIPRLSETLRRAKLPPECDALESKTRLVEREEKFAESQRHLEKLLDALGSLTKAESTLQEIQKSFQNAELELAKKTASLEQKESDLLNRSDRLNTRQAEVQRQRVALLEALEGLGVNLAVEDQPGVTSVFSHWNALVDRQLKTLLHSETNVEKAENARRLAEGERLKAEAVLDAAKKVHAERRTATDRIKLELDERRTQVKVAREQIWTIWRAHPPGYLPDEGEAAPLNAQEALQRSKDRCTQLQMEKGSASDDTRTAQGVENQLRGSLAILKKQAQDWSEGRAVIQSKLRVQLDKLEIISEARLQEERMDPVAFAEGQKVVGALRRRAEEHFTLTSERTRALEAQEKEIAPDFVEPKSFPKGDPNPLRVALEEAKNAYAEAETRNQELQVALAELKTQARSFQQAGGKLKVAQKEGAVWIRLSELIGKRGGDAFRDFAQALNLNRLVLKANVHLKHLSNRYRLDQLKIDGFPTLDFAIIDGYQVGEPRSPRGLSGGERFLVSLALALGLSDLRSHSLPMETLLLDEGFGTLDPETLETALSALERLQGDGRQVGVISHVAGLKERILAQVHIVDDGPGRARISVQRSGEST
jgi:exonuclease SbcC